MKKVLDILCFRTVYACAFFLILAMLVKATYQSRCASSAYRVIETIVSRR